MWQLVKSGCKNKHQYCSGESNCAAISYGVKSEFAAEYVAASQNLPLNMLRDVKSRHIS
jgi:hypothetical protein